MFCIPASFFLFYVSYLLMLFNSVNADINHTDMSQMLYQCSHRSAVYLFISLAGSSPWLQHLSPQGSQFLLDTQLYQASNFSYRLVKERKKLFAAPINIVSQSVLPTLMRQWYLCKYCKSKYFGCDSSFSDSKLFQTSYKVHLPNRTCKNCQQEGQSAVEVVLSKVIQLEYGINCEQLTCSLVTLLSIFPINEIQSSNSRWWEKAKFKSSSLQCQFLQD